MAPKPRVQYPVAIYHVMNRGAGGKERKTDGAKVSVAAGLWAEIVMPLAG